MRVSVEQHRVNEMSFPVKGIEGQAQARTEASRQVRNEANEHRKMTRFESCKLSKEFSNPWYHQNADQDERKGSTSQPP